MTGTGWSVLWWLLLRLWIAIGLAVDLLLSEWDSCNTGDVRGGVVEVAGSLLASSSSVIAIGSTATATTATSTGGAGGTGGARATAAATTTGNAATLRPLLVKELWRRERRGGRGKGREGGGEERIRG